MAFRDVWKEITHDMSPTVKIRVITAFILTALILFAFGSVGKIPGVEGFAYASDVENIEGRIARLEAHIDDMHGHFQDLAFDVRRMQLEAQLENVQAMRCASEHSVLRQEYSNRIQRLQSQYQQLTGATYPLEPCIR